jgi:aminoglycoside 2'-N-acetyltransferase I
LTAAFDGEFSNEDWDHGLGGIHALVWEGELLVGHASVVQRQMVYAPPDGAAHGLRVGYLEAMAVRADRRRRGIGAEMMTSLGMVIRGAYDLGALSASDDGAPLYRLHGWRQWRGRAFAFSPRGIERTEDEEAGLFVLPVDELDLGGDLTCDWREGDVW